MPRSSVFVSAVCGAAAWVGLLSLSSSSSVSVSVAGQATQQVCDLYWNSVAWCENRSDADGWSDARFRACVDSSRVQWPAATYCPGPGLPPNNDRSTWRPPYLAATTTNDRAGEYGVEPQDEVESVESVDTLARCMIECVATESKVVASECRTVKFARRGECHAKAAAKAAATCSNKCAHHAPKATTTTTIVATEESVSDVAFGGACLSKCMNSYLVAMEECKPHANDDEPFAYNVCVSQKQGALIGCNVLCKRDQEEVPESADETPTQVSIPWPGESCMETCTINDRECRGWSSNVPSALAYCDQQLAACQVQCAASNSQPMKEANTAPVDANIGGACRAKCMGAYLSSVDAECQMTSSHETDVDCLVTKQQTLIQCNAGCTAREHDEEKKPEVSPTPIAYYPGETCTESCEYADHACRVSSSGSPKSIAFCTRKLTECQAKCADESTHQVASTPVGDSCARGCHASVSDWKQRVWSANQCRSYACFQWLEAQATSVLDVCHKCCDHPYASTHSCQPPPIPHFPGAAAAVAVVAPKKVSTAASPSFVGRDLASCQRTCPDVVITWRNEAFDTLGCPVAPPNVSPMRRACEAYLDAQQAKLTDMCRACCSDEYFATHSCSYPPSPTHLPAEFLALAASDATASKKVASPAINVKCSVECQDKLARCQKAAGADGVKRAQCFLLPSVSRFLP